MKLMDRMRLTALRWGSGGRAGRGYGGNVMQGGVQNNLTGLGTSADKSESNFFLPTRFYHRQPLEILCVQSSAAKKFVQMAIRDMFIRWREFETEASDNAAEMMHKAERRHQVKSKLAEAMIAGRQYGTGVLVLMTKEAPLDTPLMPERIRPGDLTAIRQFDRYDLSAYQRERDPTHENYGKPVYYDCHPHRGGVPFRAHYTRVLRFDGLMPPTDSGFTIYDQDWGVSELVPVILPIMQDAAIAGNVAHLTHEASLAVLSVTGLRELMAGSTDPGEPSATDIGNQINAVKSNFHMLMLEKGTEEFTRVAAQFSGLAPLLDRYSSRVAEAAEVPETRWRGRAPTGMNATGESDMKNYILMMEAIREEQMPDQLLTMDMVLARDAGLPEAPEYTWRSLLEMSDGEQAEVSAAKVKAVREAVDGGMIDEDEGRAALDGDAVLGALPGDAPEPEPLPEPPAPAPGLPIPKGPAPDGGDKD